MKTTRIILLKTSKRFRHRRDKYLSYVRPVRSRASLPELMGPGRARLDLSRSPVIFFTPGERAAIARAVTRLSPESRHATIQDAERFRGGEIDIFGHPINIMHGIDWHRDYPTGRIWPKIPAARISIMHPDDKSDIKTPWEIARFQFLSTLGRAWAYTGKPDYANLARKMIESFQSENPPGIGIHWINPMEAAIRAASWIVATSYFKDVPGWDNEFHDKMRGSLFEHGRFIRRYLERDGRGINNNHYTADLAGLFIIGLYLGEIDECRKWLEFSLAELHTEVNSQITRDGMHYENSLGYHRLTFEMFFITQRLALMNDIESVNQWSPILARMAEFTLAATMPNGRVPNFGDNDDGVWLAGSTRPSDDHRYIPLLATAAFGQPTANALNPTLREIPEDVFWYLGAKAAETAATQLKAEPAASSRLVSRIFNPSGIVFLRSPNSYVMVSANPVGTGGIGGHKHNDLLSYIFTVGDNEIVIDPGTYAYTAEPSLRNALRGTRAHNTVMVDGAEQNRFYPRQLFWVRNDARPEICDWTSDHELDRLIVRHDGYRRLAGNIIHTRHFVFDKTNTILAVHDELSGTGTHDISSTINFGDGMLTPAKSGQIILRCVGNQTEAAFLIDARLPWHSVIEPTWRSDSYRQKRPCYRLVQRCRAKLPFAWTTVIGVFQDRPIDWIQLEEFAAAFFAAGDMVISRVVSSDKAIGDKIAV